MSNVSKTISYDDAAINIVTGGVILHPIIILITAIFSDGDDDQKDLDTYTPEAEHENQIDEESSSYDMGLKYYNGNGVPQDYTEAFSFFTESAEQGDIRAQNFLGILYLNGTGVEKNNTIAFKWFVEAATRGLSSAQFNIANMYEKTNEKIEAYAWYNVAQAYGDEDAQENRDSIELNSFDLQQAQALSTELFKEIEWKKET
jgi:TPR repeat protein